MRVHRWSDATITTNTPLEIIVIFDLHGIAKVVHGSQLSNQRNEINGLQ